MWAKIICNSILYDDSGREVLIQGLLVDISDRKQAEKDLKKSEKKYASLVQNINEYIYSEKFKKGELVSSFHSPRSVDITGYEPTVCC